MKNKKAYIEKHFDSAFSANPKIKYEFNLKKMGVKDKKIIKLLLDYGIVGKKCLDVGPGTGRWLQFLKSGATWLGAIDFSQQSLDRCSKLCNKVQKADVESDEFDFQSNFFDIILSFEVIEHLIDPSNYISEMLRVAKNGGMILMSTPNIISLISRVRMLFGQLPVAITVDKTHFRFYRQKDIINLLSYYKIKPIFIPTSISLNPLNPKSKFRIPSLSK